VSLHVFGWFLYEIVPRILMINKNLLYKNLNEGILEEKYASFLNNLNKNYSLIKKHGGLKDVVDSFRDRHVIVVGAGPSLEGNIALLKKYQYRDEFVIISTDMALKTLCRNGITPSYAISCETTPVDFFWGIDTSVIRLFAFSCMSHSNLNQWKGPVHFYNWMLEGEEYQRLWEISGMELGYVATGNTVTTQAVSLALGCSIGSLILVGNDMGFSDRYYAEGSVFSEKNRLKHCRFQTMSGIEYGIIRKNRQYEVRRGQNVFYTNSQFLASRLWLEDIFSRQALPVYDCSVPGCSGKYVNRIELKDYFSTYDRKRRQKRR